MISARGRRGGGRWWAAATVLGVGQSLQHDQGNQGVEHPAEAFEERRQLGADAAGAVVEGGPQIPCQGAGAHKPLR